MDENPRLSGFPPYKTTTLSGSVRAEPDAAREIRAVTSEKIIRANAERLNGVRQGIIEGRRMAALPNRLTEKLTKASGVLQRRIVATEARADALIAREDALQKREDESFGPHEQAATLLEKQYDAVERNYDILENGNPLAGSEKQSIGSGDVGVLKIEGEEIKTDK